MPERSPRKSDLGIQRLETDGDIAIAALKTLGFTDPVRIGWLAEGKRPGTVGWALKVMAEAKEKRP